MQFQFNVFDGCLINKLLLTWIVEILHAQYLNNWQSKTEDRVGRTRPYLSSIIKIVVG